MLENILAVLAALIVIFFAGLLVKKQNKCHKIAEELSKEVDEKTEDVINECIALSGEDLDEYTLTHLECIVDKVNARLDEIEYHRDSRLERRIKKCKTSKKSWK